MNSRINIAGKLSKYSRHIHLKKDFYNRNYSRVIWSYSKISSITDIVGGIRIINRLYYIGMCFVI